jgi:hypothetical protein
MDGNYNQPEIPKKNLLELIHVIQVVKQIFMTETKLELPETCKP